MWEEWLGSLEVSEQKKNNGEAVLKVLTLLFS